MTPLIGFSQAIAKFEVDLSRETNGISVPVTIDLGQFTISKGTKLSLVKPIDKKISVSVPFQLDWENKTLSFIIVRDKKNDEKKLQYELVTQSPSKFSNIEAEDKDGAITIHSGKTNLLRYVYKKVYPPAGIDSAFGRSGFIHPLWTPHGQELTRIQPPDYYHHYGIWNPWTHVLFEKDTVDFWNIGGKQATVRFAKFISQTNGTVFSEFTTCQLA